MSIPMQWTANVKIPYYGWFGQDDFSCKQDARNYVAKAFRAARRGNKIGRPSYSSRAYYVRPHLLRVED